MLFRIDINKLKRSVTTLIVLLVTACLISSSFAVPVSAAINQEINYQGKLTDSVGSAVADGTYSVVYSLYTVSSGGSAIWTETQNVTATNGLFSVMLGSVTPLSTVNFNQTLYLGVNVAGDGEMVPRKKIGSVPTAFTSDKLDNLDSTDFLSTSTASAPNLFSLTGLGQIGSSTATTTFLGRLAVTGQSVFANLLTAYQTITAPNFVATSSTASVLPYASSTAITVSGTASTTNLIVSSSSQLGTITSGTWNGSVVGVGYGGTGLASTPSYGQILVGNGTGYTLSATSTLGVALSDTTGTLGGTRGGTGLSSVTLNELLIGGAGNTWSQVATSSLGLPTFSSLADYLSLTSWYATTTDGLDEGGTNLYFTDNRFDTRLSATTSLSNVWSLTGLGQIGSSSAVTTISGTASSSALIVSGGVQFSSLISCDTIDTDASGNLSCGTDAGAGGGISSLNGLTNASQTFATSSDTNVTLTVTSTGSTHTFTSGWTGTLAVGRGGTGLSSTPSFGQILVGNGTGYTLTATSSLGLLTTNVAEGSNLYFLDSRARAAISETITGIDYDNSSGVFSLTSDFNIPLTASTTNWNGFYDTPSTRITAGTGLGWSGNTLNSTLASNWSFDTNFSQSVLTASSTIPVWFKDSIYASSTLTVQGANFATTTIGSNDVYLQFISRNLLGVLDVPIISGRTSLGTSGAGVLDTFNLIGDSNNPSFDFYGTSTFNNAKITFDLSSDILNFTGTEGYYFDNNLGIGTTSPMSKLSVDGSVTFQGDSFATTTIGDKNTFLSIVKRTLGGGALDVSAIQGRSSIGGTGVGALDGLYILDDTTGSPFISFAASSTINTASLFYSVANDRLDFSDAVGGYTFDGNVGVGSTTPSKSLSVIGDTYLKGITSVPLRVEDSATGANLSTTFKDLTSLGIGITPVLKGQFSNGLFGTGFEQSIAIFASSTLGFQPSFTFYNETPDNFASLTYATSTDKLLFEDATSYAFDNFVGIGTTTPTYNLSVDGKIGFRDTVSSSTAPAVLNIYGREFLGGTVTGMILDGIASNGNNGLGTVREFAIFGGDSFNPQLLFNSQDALQSANIGYATTTDIMSFNAATGGYLFNTVGDGNTSIRIAERDLSGVGIANLQVPVIFGNTLISDAGELRLTGINNGIIIIEDSELNQPPSIAFAGANIGDTGTTGNISYATSTGSFSFDSSATTTATYGFNITDGCYAIGGTCFEGSKWISNGNDIIYAAGNVAVLNDDSPTFTLGNASGSSFTGMTYSTSTDILAFVSASGGYTFDDDVGVTGNLTSNGNRFVTGIFDGDFRVGIGISSPTALLTIDGNDGSNSELLSIINLANDPVLTVKDNQGLIGIGTSTPVAKLQINSGESSGLIPAFIVEADGDSDDYIAKFRANTGAAGYSDTDNKMVIMGSGNVGIGTTTPNTKLVVTDTGQNQLRVETTNSSSYATIRMTTPTRTYQFGTGGSGTGLADDFYVYDEASSTTRFLVDNTGNVGIGDSSPSEAKLTVGGTFYVLTNTAVGADPLCWDGSGGSLYGDCTSLGKYKANREDLEIGLAEILALQPRTFDWKRHTDGTLAVDNPDFFVSDIGFIAEEVEAVSSWFAKYNYENNELTGIRERGILAATVNAIKEQQEMILQLDMRISSSSLENIQAITSASGNWSIDEDGTFVAKTIKAENIFSDQGVMVKDKTSGEWYCMYVDGGNILTQPGECSDVVGQQTVNSNSGGGDSYSDPTSGTGSGDTGSSTPDDSPAGDDNEDPQAEDAPVTPEPESPPTADGSQPADPVEETPPAEDPPPEQEPETLPPANNQPPESTPVT